jgi:hypothetical protein
MNTALHSDGRLNTGWMCWQVWFIKVRKIKAIYHTLNYFNLDTSQKCLIAGETLIYLGYMKDDSLWSK